jgi:hypothetical protein
MDFSINPLTLNNAFVQLPTMQSAFRVSHHLHPPPMVSCLHMFRISLRQPS